jgi:hypothetical protein
MTFKLTNAQQRALDYVYQKATQNKKHDMKEPAASRCGFNPSGQAGFIQASALAC